jgi:hypothetical protein
LQPVRHRWGRVELDRLSLKVKRFLNQDLRENEKLESVSLLANPMSAAIDTHSGREHEHIRVTMYVRARKRVSVGKADQRCN